MGNKMKFKNYILILSFVSKQLIPNKELIKVDFPEEIKPVIITPFLSVIRLGL